MLAEAFKVPALTVPTEKLPLPSRATIALLVFELVAVVAELDTFELVDIVANLLSAIAAEAFISAFIIMWII